jgi:hypothetical protein
MFAKLGSARPLTRDSNFTVYLTGIEWIGLTITKLS